MTVSEQIQQALDAYQPKQESPVIVCPQKIWNELHAECARIGILGLPETAPDPKAPFFTHLRVGDASVMPHDSVEEIKVLSKAEYNWLLVTDAWAETDYYRKACEAATR